MRDLYHRHQDSLPVDEPVKTYINCDLRYFNLEDIVDNLGKFDGNTTQK